MIRVFRDRRYRNVYEHSGDPRDSQHWDQNYDQYLDQYINTLNWFTIDKEELI